MALAIDIVDGCGLSNKGRCYSQAKKINLMLYCPFINNSLIRHVRTACFFLASRLTIVSLDKVCVLILYALQCTAYEVALGAPS